MPYCHLCSRSFANEDALEQHSQNSPKHPFCRTCERSFSSRKSLLDHYIHNPRHYYCEYCDEHFDDSEELSDHDDSVHYTCGPCNRTFNTRRDLQSHQAHNHCIPCNRYFQSESALAQHLNSSVHVEQSVPCGCGRTFGSASALSHHMESGGCSSGMNRHRLNNFVVSRDTSNLITYPPRLLTLPTGYVETWATELAWNGAAYECYFCHSTFGTLVSLNQHLQSPRHDDKIYVCPKSDCGQHFSVLSALCQHIESEKCGVLRFRQVKAVMDSFISGSRRITAR